MNHESREALGVDLLGERKGPLEASQKWEKLTNFDSLRKSAAQRN